MVSGFRRLRISFGRLASTESSERRRIRRGRRLSKVFLPVCSLLIRFLLDFVVSAQSKVTVCPLGVECSTPSNVRRYWVNPYYNNVVFSNLSKVSKVSKKPTP